MDKKQLSAHDKELIDRIGRDNINLAKEKDDMLPIYTELSRYLKPTRSGWGFERDSNAEFGRFVFDGEAISAKNKLSDGLFGYMVSPSIDWLKLTPRDPAARDDRKVQMYCRQVVQHLMDTFARSNFYETMSEAIDDGVVFGTEVINVEENKEKGEPVYEALHLREIMISENRAGEVDLLHREFEMTFRQLIEEFGEEALDDNDKKTALENMEQRVRVIHAVYPRSFPGNTDNSVKLDIEKPYASVYLYCGHSIAGTERQGAKYVLREGGFDFKRFVAWRFKKSAGMTYGGSPGMDAIFDIKMLNMQSKTMADVGQLAARPPMSAPMAMKGNLRIQPGGISYYTGDARVQPIMTTISYPFGIDTMERRARIIRDHFKTDFFMAVSQNQATSRDRTATEIMEMKAESAAVFGSVVGCLQSELIEPIVMLTMQIEGAAGRMPLVPDGVNPDIAIDLEFIGPLAQAQRKYLVKQGIEQGLQSAFNMAQANPDLMMNIDMNSAMRKLMLVNGFPPEDLYDPKQVQQSQAQAQQARAQAQQEAMALEKAKVLSGANKTPEDGSPLASVMGKK